MTDNYTQKAATKSLQLKSNEIDAVIQHIKTKQRQFVLSNGYYRLQEQVEAGDIYSTTAIASFLFKYSSPKGNVQHTVHFHGNRIKFSCSCVQEGSKFALVFIVDEKTFADLFADIDMFYLSELQAANDSQAVLRDAMLSRSEKFIERFPVLPVFVNLVNQMQLRTKGLASQLVHSAGKQNYAPNFDVVAMIVNTDYVVVNYATHQDKDLHAEVQVLDQAVYQGALIAQCNEQACLEGAGKICKFDSKTTKHVLITSLEPCQQCCGKIVHSKCDYCLYTKQDVRLQNKWCIQGEATELKPMFFVRRSAGIQTQEEFRKYSQELVDKVSNEDVIKVRIMDTVTSILAKHIAQYTAQLSVDK